MSDLQLPSEISSDGRELWNWAAQFSAAINKQDAINKLERQIASVGTKCGDCSRWMRRDCPKEQNVNGRNKGPSMSSTICDAFMEAANATKWRMALEGKLKELQTV